MKIFSIDKSILKKAADCIYGFSCLETGMCGEGAQCAVCDVNGENVLFLEDEAPKSCPYRVTYGGEQLCSCPVHYSIIKKYGNPPKGVSSR